MNLVIEGTFQKSWRAWVVYLVFGATILLWLTGSFHGLNSYIVAMLPVSVFLTTRILTKEDLKLLSWDVLWLISGGIALGYGLEQTGLSKTIIAQVPFSEFPALVIIIAASLVALLMSTFISNTATANLILPLMAALAASEPALQALGGELLLLCDGSARQHASERDGVCDGTAPQPSPAQNWGAGERPWSWLCVPTWLDPPAGGVLLISALLIHGSLACHLVA